MNSKIFTNNKYLFATGLLIVSLIIFLFPFLSLPYFWDEAWVYGKGMRTMAINGTGLLSDALPVEISRGHPLLFYFLGSAWLKLFGNTIFASHAFVITVSVIFVLVVYKLCADFLSKRPAFFVVTLLMLQPIFLAQSCLVLPEMMLAMWTILCLWSFYSGKKLLYILFGALLILTKETGIVCILAIGLNEFLFDLFSKQSSGEKARSLLRVFKNYKRYLLICVPVIIASIHFFIQKSMYGWFFFPEHVGYISFNWAELSQKFVKYFSYLFIFDGRNALFFGGLIALVVMFIKRRKAENVSASESTFRVLVCLALFIFLFLAFSSANFYSNRYLMSLIAPLIILSVYLIDSILWKPVLKWTAFTVLAVTGIYYSISTRTNSDHNLGYTDCVKLYKKAIDYCVKEKLNEKKTMAGFLMNNALTDTLAGYVDKKGVFVSADSKFDPTVELCIFSSIEQMPYSDSIKANVPMKPLKNFSSKNVTIEIFEIIR